MIEIIRYKSVPKGARLGFFDMYVPSLDWEIKGCTLFQKEGNRFFSFPAKAKEVEGETKYFPYLKVRSQERKETLRKDIIDAIDNYCKNNQPQQDVYGDQDIPF